MAEDRIDAELMQCAVQFFQGITCDIIPPDLAKLLAQYADVKDANVEKFNKTEIGLRNLIEKRKHYAKV